MRILSSKRRQRVLHLNPPYTLVQPEVLQHDLWKSLVPLETRDSFVYVSVEGGVLLGYVQARSRWRRRDEWAITTLAQIDRAPDYVPEALLEEVCRAAGEHGVTRIFVKVPQEEASVEPFRRLGFTHYTSERIWGNLYFGSLSASGSEPTRKPLRSQIGQDAWDLVKLYTSVTPPAVQRAEDLNVRQWQRSRMPAPWFLSHRLVENSYVWPDADEKRGLGGYARLLTGARGHWITMLCRPDQANRKVCEGALDYVLWKAARQGNKPVYCGVREYQAELEGQLESRGFHPLSEQVLLVKYLVKPIAEWQPARLPFLVAKPRDLVASEFSHET